MNNAATLTNGIGTLSEPSFVGMTVADVFNDDVLVNFLSLTGEETATVGGNAVQRNYTIKAGDTVRFGRAGGTKGSI